MGLRCLGSRTSEWEYWCVHGYRSLARDADAAALKQRHEEAEGLGRAADARLLRDAAATRADRQSAADGVDLHCHCLLLAEAEAGLLAVVALDRVGGGVAVAVEAVDSVAELL